MRHRHRPETIESAKVIRVDLDIGLKSIEIEDRYARALLIITSRDRFMGQVMVPAEGILTAERQWDAITNELEPQLWTQRVRDAFTRATRGSANMVAQASEPSVSVIVCTRDRAQDLRSCLASLSLLRTSPREVIVVDNCPSDDEARRVCREFPVRYLVEPTPGKSRALNLGILEADSEVVAFLDDDCIADPRWLDGLHDPFDDPLVMTVTGYAGPLELETRSQYLFEVHGGFQRYHERRVFDGAHTSPVRIAAAAGAGANSLFRRKVFEEVGFFADDLGPGTPTLSAEDKYAFYRVAQAGYRIVFDPARIVWHRHRRDYAALRRTLFGYTVGEFAYTTRCLLQHREPSVLSIWRWWPKHLRHDLGQLWRGDERAIPLELIAAEAAGIAVGPWRLWRTAHSRRRLPARAQMTRQHGRTSLLDRAEGPRVSVADAPLPSVVIASHNRREQLRKVLSTLAHQSYPVDRLEVVVVLDGSIDGSGDCVRALDLPYEVKLLEQENMGLAASRNRGAREASNPLVVFLDDDIVPEPQFLTEHVNAHRGDGDHVALGYYPPVLDRHDLWGYVLRSWWEDHFRRKAQPDHQWTFIDFVDGNSSLPRELLLACGGYDEDFKGRRQDWELGIRLLKRGVYFTYHPQAKGWHHADTSFTTAVRHARQEARDDVLLGQKHPPVKSRLPLAGIAGRGPQVPRRILTAYQRPQASARLLSEGLVALKNLERLRLRARWYKLAHALLRHAYRLGVTDILHTPDSFVEFFTPLWEGQTVESVPVSMDAPGNFQVPAGSGTMELRLNYGGVAIASVPALQIAGQWDWSAVTERAVWAAWEPMRRAVLHGEHPPIDRADGSISDVSR